MSGDLLPSSALARGSTQSFAERGNVPLRLQVASLEDDAASCQVFYDTARVDYCPSAWQVRDRKDTCRHNGGWCAATWVEVDVKLVYAFLCRDRLAIGGTECHCVREVQDDFDEVSLLV